MKYKETIRIAKENDINYIDLLVAKEVEFWFEDENDATFEEICELTKDVYLNEKEHIETILYTIYRLVKKYKKCVTKLTKSSVIDLMSKILEGNE